MAKKIWIGTTNDWGTAGNWSGSGVPANGDDVYFDSSVSQDVGAGLNQSAVTLASLNIAATFIGKIGTASAYLQVGATLLNIGAPSLSGTPSEGSQRIKIDLGSVQSAVVVFASNKTTADTGLEPIRIKGTHASNTLNVLGGRVGVATTSPSEVATIATVKVTGNTSFLNLSAGCTLTTITNNGGTVNVNSAATTITNISGNLKTGGTGLIGTFNADGGGVVLNNRASGDDVTTLSWNGANIDWGGNPDAFIANATTIKRGGTGRWFSATQVNLGTVTVDPTYGTAVSIQLA